MNNIIRKRINWSLEKDNISRLLEQGFTAQKISEHYNVSRAKIYQVLNSFGLDTPQRKTGKNRAKGLSREKLWLHRTLVFKGIPKEEGNKILENLEVPKYCPILGLELDYEGGKYRSNSSPSIDRIDPTKGYKLGNIHIISWRANRIKNDASPEELLKIAKYINNLTLL